MVETQTSLFGENVSTRRYPLEFGAVNEEIKKLILSKVTGSTYLDA